MKSYFINLTAFFLGNLPSAAGISKNSTTAGRIRASQIAALTNVTPLMMLANIVNLGIVLLFIRKDPFAEFLPIWGIILCCFSALGIYQWHKVGDRKSYSVSLRAQKIPAKCGIIRRNMGNYTDGLLSLFATGHPSFHYRDNRRHDGRRCHVAVLYP